MAGLSGHQASVCPSQHPCIRLLPMLILVASHSWLRKGDPQDPHLSLWTDLSASVQGSPRVALNFGSRTRLNFYVVTRPGKNTILLLKSSQDFGGASTSVAPPPTRVPPGSLAFPLFSLHSLAPGIASGFLWTGRAQCS